MQIKPQALAQYMKREPLPLYVLIGQDPYLLDESFRTIKSSLKSAKDCDEAQITIQTADDWKSLNENADSYSLFAPFTLINAIYDKKTLDAAGKKALNQYLDSDNSRCFVILRAANLPAKQIQWLSSHEKALILVIYPLNTDAMKQWIATQLQQASFTYEAGIPDLIHQFTQGNMLACAQIIEKLSLSNAPNSKITPQEVLEHASNQCSQSLYELVDACLLGQAAKAIQILRQTANDKTEATLVLWMLTQELRTLLQLLNSNAHIKIWPQRASMYQLCLKRFNASNLQALISYCKSIDEAIKSGGHLQIWNALECLALSLCLGQLKGGACSV
ncbi:MAG: DNA polymerase III subunit delta [Legionella sp.]|jgi:DNA polymerase-3 subunit delta